MADDFKKAINAPAWHSDEPYDEKEVVRLKWSCELLRRHRAELGLGRRYDVVDVGCGVGPLRQWLDAEGFRIVGLEIGEAAAQIARGHYDACEVCDVDTPWPLEAASFDGVHAGYVLEHAHDWHAPLNHANTVLRDGGMLVVSVPNLRYWKELRRLIRGRQPHWLQDMKHVHGFTPDFLIRLVGIHGFEVCSLEADRVNFPLLPKAGRWLCRHFGRWGSTLILSAKLRRRVRVEDHGREAEFPRHKPVACRAIEVLE